MAFWILDSGKPEPEVKRFKCPDCGCVFLSDSWACLGFDKAPTTNCPTWLCHGSAKFQRDATIEEINTFVKYAMKRS